MGKRGHLVDIMIALILSTIFLTFSARFYDYGMKALVVPGGELSFTIFVNVCVGIVLTAIIVITAVRIRKHVIDEARHVLEFDTVTGLPGKILHKKEAQKLIDAKEAQYAYAICNINDFKFLNENVNFEYGNKVLKSISDSLKSDLVKGELVSRTSGDNFGMLLKYESPNLIEERLRGMLEKASEIPEDDNGKQHTIVLTCGIYLLKEGDDINKARSRANIARRAQRKEIGSKIGFYSEDDLVREMEDRELEANLKMALKEKQFLIYLQPKFSLEEERVVGAEALVRWNHPEKGMILPGRFIPLCEVNGFVREIDFYVLEKVCEVIKGWLDNGIEPVKISVNFSRVHLWDKDFVKHLTDVVKKNGVSTDLIEIELTETVEYKEIDHLLEIMHLIKSEGFGLSMDDFGTGYSSLQLLTEMPVDVLKLDKGFMDRYSNDNNGREKSILSHVIAMAKDLQIDVLAEGVETEEQRDFLKASNCDMIQGFYYARPMPIVEFERYLSKEKVS